MSNSLSHNTGPTTRRPTTSPRKWRGKHKKKKKKQQLPPSIKTQPKSQTAQTQTLYFARK